MKRIVLPFLLVLFTVSCGDRESKNRDRDLTAGTQSDIEADASEGRRPGTVNNPEATSGSRTVIPDGAVLIASDIVTEIVVRPDPEGDPWEAEKVAGYNGQPLVDGIFSSVYDGTMTVYDYHSGEPLSRADVKKIEDEFKNDRTKIGKLSFTEDWYYYPATNRVEKKAKSVTFGYELYNNLGKVYAYRAAFRADLN